MSALKDEEIRGAVLTRLFVLVLKHIFDQGLGGQLDEILQLAAEVIQLSSGMAMVMALLRYIARSGVGVKKEVVARKLLAVLPKEGGVLMQTMAEAWIEEGKVIGFQEGVQEGQEKGRQEGKNEARVDLILLLLRRRFQPTEEMLQSLAQQLAEIHNAESLDQLLNAALDVLVLPDFIAKLHRVLPAATAQQ